MLNYRIMEPNRGEVIVELKPGIEVNRNRDSIKSQLEIAKFNKRIAGYDVTLLKEGRIVVYYNSLIDEYGKAATYVAQEIAKSIFSE